MSYMVMFSLNMNLSKRRFYIFTLPMIMCNANVLYCYYFFFLYSFDEFNEWYDGKTIFPIKGEHMIFYE